MIIKSSVKVSGMRAELVFAQLVAKFVYMEFGYEFVITSIMDGKHSLTSSHYRGEAFDCRTRHLEGNEAAIAKEIQYRLGIDFDVLLEDTHIHVQFKPKYR